jgi:hypothetical protein
MKTLRCIRSLLFLASFLAPTAFAQQQSPVEPQAGPPVEPASEVPS